jgi:hypothetical protein
VRQCGALNAALACLAAIGYGPAKTGAVQWFITARGNASDIHRNDEAVDDAGGWARWERNHARLYQMGLPAREGGPVTAAPIHHDLPTPTHWPRLCGEIATDFDGSRDDVAKKMESRGWAVTRVQTRERRSVRQCDGSRVEPDGWIVLIG